MLISFDKDMELGNELIDAQHHMLIMLLKKLDIALKQNLPHKVIMGILLEIKKFTEFHFLCEENLMYELKYPEVVRHEKIHSGLLFQFEVIIAKVNQKQMFADETLDMLYRWVTAHAMHEDGKIVDHIKRNGFLTVGEAQHGLYLGDT